MALIFRSGGVWASARAAATFLASGCTKAPDGFLIDAIPSELALANETSA